MHPNQVFFIPSGFSAGLFTVDVPGNTSVIVSGTLWVIGSLDRVLSSGTLFGMSWMSLSVSDCLSLWSCLNIQVSITVLHMCLMFLVIMQPERVSLIWYDLMLCLALLWSTTLPWVQGPPSSL